MFKNLRDKLTFSGIIMLAIGSILLIFTFISAYGFLTQSLEILTPETLVNTFGDVLAPLVVTCIRIMYLGIMCWTASLFTIRGVTILANASRNGSTAIKKAPLQNIPTKKDRSKKEQLNEEEPDILLIPPDETEAQVSTSRKKKKRASKLHKSTGDSSSTDKIAN